MGLDGLGFAILVWIPGVLHAVQQPCSAPNLNHGYFLPVQESYPHEESITYSCDTGYKPRTEGWWATIPCDNGEWSDDPQCVEETACPPPVIRNGRYIGSSKAFYKNGSTLEINCMEGYSFGDQNNTVQCIRGTWSPVLVCKKHPKACGQPPHIPNAVITNREQKEVYIEISKVQYMCRDGFLTEDRESTTDVYCVNGTWSRTPKCLPSARPGSKGPESSFLPIHNCGDSPDVPNAVVMEQEIRSLKYSCQTYYKLVGPETVVCYSDKSWSEVPKCKENFCVLRPGAYPDLKVTHDKYFINGEKREVDCFDKWLTRNYSVVLCIDGKLHVSRCCNRIQITLGIC